MRNEIIRSSEKPSQNSEDKETHTEKSKYENNCSLKWCFRRMKPNERISSPMIMMIVDSIVSITENDGNKRDDTCRSTVKDRVVCVSKCDAYPVDSLGHT